MNLKHLDRLKIDTSLLLIVDVQGNLARRVHESEQLIQQIGKVVDACQVLEVPIMWVEQMPEKLGPTVAELSSRLSGQKLMTKCSFGCCEDSQINQAIGDSGRRQILLCGIEAHVCIWQTAASLIAQEYRVHLLCDGVSSRSLLNRDVAINRIAAIGGHLSNVEMAIFDLMGTAQHPKFREVAKLFR